MHFKDTVTTIRDSLSVDVKEGKTPYIVAATPLIYIHCECGYEGPAKHVFVPGDKEHPETRFKNDDSHFENFCPKCESPVELT